ncbi:MAG: dockerin type I domain-containing protein, partial [Eubacteriales bacterium]|nr:dockerin type I domain-containing protein [Eubacteriales bacterium]
PTEPVEVKNVIYFDSNTANWGEFSKVFCHVWVYGGDAFYSWQSKKQACTDADGDGIWEYDFDAKGIVLEEGVLYAVIFSNENAAQTYNLLFDTNCLEDTAYVAEDVYENPEDSSKTCQVAFWTNQDPAVYGPEMVITSLGNVIGTCIPSSTTAQGILEAFLANAAKLENVKTYTGKNDQKAIDDIAEDLGLTVEETAEAIANTGAVVDWNADDSLIGYEPVLGDVNCDGEVSVLDATIVQRVVAKTTTLTDAESALADVNGDGEVSVLDATTIQRLVAKIITEF